MVSKFLETIFPFPLIPSSWSSLVKEEALACQITSPFNKKIGCFVRQTFQFYFLKQPSLLSNGKLAIDTSLTKDLYALIPIFFLRRLRKTASYFAREN